MYVVYKSLKIEKINTIKEGDIAITWKQRHC